LFAVVKTGGKQYRVEEGRSLKVDRLAGEPGDAVELGDVLMIGEGAEVTVGAPMVSGARVLGTITEQGRAPKIVVFRYKSKTRQRKKTGHRQHFTMLRISDVLAPGQEPKPKEDRKPRALAEEPDAAPAVEAAVATEAPAAEEKPKRSRRKAAEPSATIAETAEASAEASNAAPAEEKPKRPRRKKTE
jgi:large subunit ribosomal protein L21